MNKKLFLGIAKDLNQNLMDYIKINRIMKRHSCNWRTAKSYCNILVNVLRTLNVQHLSMLYDEFQQEIESEDRKTLTYNEIKKQILRDVKKHKRVEDVKI